MTVDPSWQLGLALVGLLMLAIAWSLVGRLALARPMARAAVRAVLQLAAVSLIIVAALTHVLAAIGFGLVMFVVAAWTTSGRVEARRSIGWIALAMAAGILPVMLIIFFSGVMPFEGISIVPIAGIIIGNAMNGNTLLCRRAFATLREQHGLYEAGLSIGLVRSEAIGEVIARRTREALLPNLDTTRTVGLVTLPGAFVGVLLGGGTPVQAGAAQVLVLIGIMAAQTGTVVTAERFIRLGRLLPADLAGSLRP